MLVLYNLWKHLYTSNSIKDIYNMYIVYLRNKSWKPECVGSYIMDWRILVFYPEPEARDKIY